MVNRGQSLLHSEKWFADLASRSEQIRLKAAKDMRGLVEAEIRDMSAEAAHNLLNDLNGVVFQLVNSIDPVQKLGGILVIEEFLDMKCEENDSMITRFAMCIRILFTNSSSQLDDTDVLQSAAKALGLLAIEGGAPIVGSFVELSLDWLREVRQERRRHAAVLILKELAESTPTLFNVHVPKFLDLIWVALRDQKTMIRECAVEALRACLNDIGKREREWRLTCYCKIFEAAQAGFRAKTSNVHVIHGSLLTLGELLATTGDFMLSRFKIVCDGVLQYKDHKNGAIALTVISVIPRLASLCPEAFVHEYLTLCVDHIIQQTKGPGRHVAFLALGELAMAVGSVWETDYTDIMRAVLDALSTPQKKKQFADEALTCVGMLSKASGNKLYEPIGRMIELMFNTGLTQTLIDALGDVSASIPKLLLPIQDHLLDNITSILMPQTQGVDEVADLGSNKRNPIGASSHRVPLYAAPITGVQPQRKVNTQPMETMQLRILALKTLGAFDFSGQSYRVVRLVLDCVLDYLDDPAPFTRRTAALACTSLARKIKNLATNQMTFLILKRLVIVAIADPQPLIRKAVLNSLSLDGKLDKYLAQGEILQSLFVSLNDEEHEVREETVTILGRLSTRNPALVMPALRKKLIRLLSELEQFNGETLDQEETSKLLMHLIGSAPELIQPYVAPILNVLVPKLTGESKVNFLEDKGWKTSGSKVGSHVLETLGKLAMIGGEEMVRYLKRLLPLIIITLQDKTSAFMKRKVALRTLRELIASTGYVVQLCEEYPPVLSILFDIIRTEAARPLRIEAIKVMGTIGALDPVKFKKLTEGGLLQDSKDQDQNSHNQNAQSQKQQHTETAGGAWMASQSLEDYYPSFAITTLMGVLQDPRLNKHHNTVIKAVMFIFGSLGYKCVPFLPNIIPPFLKQMRACEDSLKETFFQHLRSIVNIVKKQARPYLGDIIQLVLEHWSQTALLDHILSVIEEISENLPEDFKRHLPSIIPYLLRVLNSDREEDRSPTLRILKTIVIFANSSILADYLYVILPALLRACESQSNTLEVQMCCITTITTITRRHKVGDQASRLIHPISRILTQPVSTLHVHCLEVLCCLMKQMGSTYIAFDGMIKKALGQRVLKEQLDDSMQKALGYYNRLVEQLIERIQDGKNRNRAQGGLPVDTERRLSSLDYSLMAYNQGGLEASESINSSNSRPTDRSVELETPRPTKKLHVSQDNLKKAWTPSNRSTEDDWGVWMRGFQIKLLEESPSSAIRACSTLANKFEPLAKELFNAAFLSCWSELSDTYQDDLVVSLEESFRSPNIPPEICQGLLNLVDFMDHHDQPLPIDICLLSQLSQRCQSFAKALHCKEMEFQTSPDSTIDALIAINNKLQLPEAAAGILTFAQQHCAVDVKESWYEELGRYKEALQAYERKQLEDPLSIPLALGRMRCLKALGEWGRLTALSQQVWGHTTDVEVQKKVAYLAADAACHMRDWKAIPQYLSVMDEKLPRTFLYNAVAAVHDDNFALAREHIERAYELLDTNLSTLMGESYNRAYLSVVDVQQLVELEEAMIFKEAKEHKRQLIRKIWGDRLKVCAPDVSIWEDIMSVRSLVLSPREDMETWLSFATICRRHGRLHLSLKVLTTLLGDNPVHFVTNMNAPLPKEHPRMAFACLKYLYSAGYQKEAYARLCELVDNVSINNNEQGGTQNLGKYNNKRQLKSKCFLKLGTWRQEFMENPPANAFGKTRKNSSNAITEALSYFHEATICNEQNYKAWHSYAVTNFVVVSQWHSNPESQPSQARRIVPAIHGFFKSIALQQQNGVVNSHSSRQDALRLLALWFQHGMNPEVEQALAQGINTISIDTWLAVIPQALARIHSKEPRVRNLLHDLLKKIGKAHPQALVYPLSVATKSRSSSRRTAAFNILNDMRNHSPELVEQAISVSNELVRVAILWHEQWHEAIDDASRLWFGQKDPDAMIEKLKPLHLMMEKGPPATQRERAFAQIHGKELKEAWELIKEYQNTRNQQCLHQAWDLYSTVFGKMQKFWPNDVELQLSEVSPKLLEANNMQLAMPGSYCPPQPIVRIGKFAPVMQVIESKQHPRKLSIWGSDGNEVQFLLKGHEDLRQDERVMQLFSLVNTMLANEPLTSKTNLDIHGYAVIPLSSNSGLIGWVPDTDTVHTLIKQYREMRDIQLNVEQRLMLKMGPDFQTLTLIQKVEVFEYSLSRTTGTDLCNILWLKSPNAEVWLDHRTNYTRSLAVMSMVGYILGLGDRHPCNLMLARNSGKIIHIDFGDCFEVAMKREKYPERVPFRLTRMLINAMEVSGIEGTFRSTCESVMAVLRKNKNSVMAILEAFVYDPLISSSIIDRRDKDKKKDEERSANAMRMHMHAQEGIGVQRVLPGIQTSIMPGLMQKVREQEEAKSKSDRNTDELNEEISPQAVNIIARVESKLKGTDFETEGMELLSVPEQVDKLIKEATSHHNLCQAYIGWCPFW